MLKEIKNTVKKFHLPGRQAGLLGRGDRVIIALSGGPDSVSLLLALNILKKELGLTLACAHLNHKLRQKESDRDQKYAVRLAGKLKVPIFTTSKDIKKIAAEKGLSIEQAARQVRYEFLLESAKTFKANKIAVGHTRDDQAETLLMRLLRGSGLRGLRSIPPVREISQGIYIIRPLIETSRKQIDSFLRQKKTKARLDSTNLQTLFLRNKIRHKLLPLLEKDYSAKIKDTLARTAETLNADYDYLLARQRAAFKKAARIKTDTFVEVPVKKLKSLEPSLKTGVVRLAIENVKGSLENIDYRHWERIEDLINGNLNCVNLPGRVKVTRTNGSVQFFKEGTVQKNSPNFLLEEKIITARPKILGKSKKIEYFDFEKIAFPLKIRYRRPHDRIKPLGMKKYKRLQDVFIDDKVKAQKRPQTPIIVDSKGRIVWVYGVRMSEDFKITPHTRKYFRLSLIKNS